MKFIIILLFSFIIANCAYAGVFDSIKNRFEDSWNSDYSVRTVENEFKTCEKFNTDPSDVYYVNCHQKKLNIESNFDDFEKSLKQIERKVLDNEFLSQLQKQVQNDLYKNYQVLQELETCLTSAKVTVKCDEKISLMIQKIKTELPPLRVLMAQKDMAGHIYQKKGKEVKRYYKNLVHDLGNRKIQSLTSEEEKFVKEHTQKLDHDFRQKVLSGETEFPIHGLEECKIKNEDNLLELKQTRTCQLLKQPVAFHINHLFDQQNKIYKKEYDKVVGQNPMLRLLSINGSESDREIKKDLLRTTRELMSNGEKAMDHINRLRGEDRRELLSFTGAVENFLKDKNDSRIYCDIAQHLKSDHEFSELSTDLYIGASALVGGGVCAFTLGLGCAVTVAVAAEVVAVSVANDRYKDAQVYHGANLISDSQLEDRAFEKNLAIYLAPLALVGHGSTAKVVAKKSTQKAKGASASREPAGEQYHSRRTNYEQRIAVDWLEKDLGPKQEILLKKYLGAPADSLSHVDQVYFAGIADLLEKQALKNNPNATDLAVSKEVKEKMDAMMKKCRGEK